MHGQPDDRERTFSVHLGKNVFHCFHADCGAKGNVLDLWAAVHNCHCTRRPCIWPRPSGFPGTEKEPVKGTR